MRVKLNYIRGVHEESYEIFDPFVISEDWTGKLMINMIGCLTSEGQGIDPYLDNNSEYSCHDFYLEKVTSPREENPFAF